MQRRTKRAISSVAASACVLTSINFSGMGMNVVQAVGQPSADIPWSTMRYELEDSRTWTGGGATADIAIKSGDRFSGGRAVDTLDKQGNGAGMAVEPEVTENGLYQVVLGYSKGRAYEEGKIALYKNETRVDYFETKTTGTSPGEEPVVKSDAIAVRLEAGDELSLRADTGDSTDAVACFDYLDVSLWGGQYEAENGTFTLENMAADEVEAASGGKAVDGFEKTDGAGVEFPFTVPADDTYYLTLGYTRINYEIEDQIGIYVDGERVGEIPLKSGGNTGDYIESDAVKMELKEGSKVTVKASTADGDQGLLMMDYLKIKPETEKAPTDADSAFSSKIFRVVSGDVLTIPVKNVPEEVVLSYESSKPEVAEVDAESGKITAKATGETIITASAGEISFTCKIQVVEDEKDLPAPVSKYEAEDSELIAGDKDKVKVQSGSWCSGGKWVELYDAGTGAAVKTTPEITESGAYELTMSYAKGSMYPNDTVSVYVNSKKVGEFKMDSGSTTTPRNTNTIVADLKPGDVVMVRKDENQNALFRYDYLMVSPVTTVPVRDITMEEKEITIADKETYLAKYTLTPEIATDDLKWESGDPSVAEADGGVIWARGTGDAEITATSIYNPEITAKMSIHVEENTKAETIASKDMEVMIDNTYPRVMQYKMLGSGNTMDGNTSPMDTVRIRVKDGNKFVDKDFKPEITFNKTAEDTAVYTMKVSELDATLELTAKVEGTILKMDFTKIEESEDPDKRIFTIELPNQNLVSVSSKEETAEFAGSRMQPDISKSGDDYLNLKTSGASSPTNYNYAFISNGKVSAGLRSNAYSTSDGDQGAPRRIIKETVEEGSAYRTSLRSGSWVWRRDDYTKTFIPQEDKLYDGTKVKVGEKTTQTYTDTPNEKDKPLVYVVLAEDLNETGTVDWQDAAIRFRDIMEMAIGMDKIPDAVVQRLIMPQAGEGNYPFISSLDETKRVYLNTDGLGQIILDKYHNLGYWGDFTVYDDHLGGLKDFKKFVDDSTDKYNGFVGVHSNFTEVFAKTNQFSAESVQANSDGTPNSKGYKAFGYFLHQCYMADDTWEAMSGERRNSMKTFVTDVPKLGFIYSDVYYWNGWRGQRLIDDYQENGLAYFVEWPYISEEASVWSHWAVEKDYSPVSNKGYSSDIARFIFNHTKDRWDNNASKCDGQRVPSSCNLLMGADTTSYEGWVHDGVNQYDYIIEKVFDNNLPTKYMQHFPIMKMEKDAEGWGEHIWFEDGLEVYRGEDGRREMTKDGKLIYTEDAYLIPWDDGDMQVVNEEENKEVKLYHWNENGGTTTWELPESWSDLGSVYVYKLTDQGKVDEQEIAVSGGTVTLNAEAKTPYVLYKGAAAPIEDVVYGDGTFVKDPGFNYGDLRMWTVEKGAPEIRKNDTVGDLDSTIRKYNGNLRNYELIVDNGEETAVSQKVTGLNGGEEYAASVMVEVEQGKERKAAIQVVCGDKTVENFTTKSLLQQWDAYDSKAGTHMLRMRVVFKVPKGEDSAVIRLYAAEGEGKVRFDNVRVYDTTTPKAPKDAENVVLYQDFEYGKRENAQNERAVNKVTYESYYPFNLGAAGGIREARAMLQTRHDPYTQNNENFGWDPKTIAIDTVLDGQNALSIITDTIGRAFQTSPQTVRFEKGHKYRISFLYQNALDDAFAFVIGNGDETNEVVYKQSLKATPAFEGSKEITYEFTCESDETWFGFDRIDRSVVVSENPNPLVLDNILVEDLSAEEPKPEPEPEEVSKTTLKYFLNKAKEHVANGDTDGVVDSVKKLFETAIAEGDAVMANEKATKEEVQNATMKLIRAIHALDMIAGDKTDLEMAVELAKEIDLTKYVEKGQAEFIAAKEAAEAVIANGDAMQGEVDSAYNALLEAMSNLRLKADKSALEDLINSVKDLDLSKYTNETVTVFKAALAEANDVMKDEQLSEDEQNKVDAAVKALKEAKAGLKLKDNGTGSDKNDGQNSGNTGNTDQDKDQKPAKDKDAPKTGDTAAMALPILMLLLAGGTIVVLKKKRTNP